MSDDEKDEADHIKKRKSELIKPSRAADMGDHLSCQSNKKHGKDYASSPTEGLTKSIESPEEGTQRVTAKYLFKSSLSEKTAPIPLTKSSRWTNKPARLRYKPLVINHTRRNLIWSPLSEAEINVAIASEEKVKPCCSKSLKKESCGSQNESEIICSPSNEPKPNQQKIIKPSRAPNTGDHLSCRSNKSHAKDYASSPSEVLTKSAESPAERTRRLTEAKRRVWLKVRTTIDQMKNLPEKNASKPLRRSSIWNNKPQYSNRSPISYNSSVIYRPRRNPISSPLSEAEINFAIASEEEVKPCCSKSLQEKNCVDQNESKVVCSSSNEKPGPKQQVVSSQRNSPLVLKKTPRYSKRNTCVEQTELESEIVWSSSESDDDKEKHLDPKHELSLFLREIEKDLQRTNRRKQRPYAKKGSYLDKLRSVIRKSKADIGFLRYEQQAGILTGLSGVITEAHTSYGAYTANATLENGIKCCFFLHPSIRSAENGKTLMSFVDSSRYYEVNDLNIFIQPTRVVETFKR